jgi:hypothetical protein
MNISITVIDNNKQRYNTVGDWYYDPTDKTMVIKVSDTGNKKYNFLIAIHELIEAILCEWAGISSELVDMWDLNYGDGEPGQGIDCPYFMQHFTATCIEGTLALMIGVNWVEYDECVNKLSKSYDRIGQDA